MGRIPKRELQELFRLADKTRSNQRRGSLLERAIRLLFETIAGVEVAEHNVRHASNTEEVDIIFWNERRTKGLYFLEAPFLVECKNWGTKVPGKEIVYFANTMRGRCCRDGILIASHGVTGDPGKLTEAHYEISVAARAGQRILVLTRNEIELLETSKRLIALLKTKILEVTVKGTKTT